MTAALAPGQTIACADADPEAFFPLARAAATSTAHRYCRTCPALDACRTSPGPLDQGIWGGQLRVLDNSGYLHTTHLLVDGQPTTTRKVTRS